MSEKERIDTAIDNFTRALRREAHETEYYNYKGNISDIALLAIQAHLDKFKDPNGFHHVLSERNAAVHFATLIAMWALAIWDANSRRTSSLDGFESEAHD